MSLCGLRHLKRQHSNLWRNCLQAIKYNYTPEEKNALAEVIGMIKSVEEVALQMETQLRMSVHRHMYTELQHFVQVEMREPLRKFGKHNSYILVG